MGRCSRRERLGVAERRRVGGTERGQGQGHRTWQAGPDPTGPVCLARGLDHL